MLVNEQCEIRRQNPHGKKRDGRRFHVPSQRKNQLGEEIPCAGDSGGEALAHLGQDALDDRQGRWLGDKQQYLCLRIGLQCAEAL